MTFMSFQARRLGNFQKSAAFGDRGFSTWACGILRTYLVEKLLEVLELTKIVQFSNASNLPSSHGIALVVDFLSFSPSRGDAVGSEQTFTHALFLLSDLEIKLVIVISAVDPVDNHKFSMLGGKIDRVLTRVINLGIDRAKCG